MTDRFEFDPVTVLYIGGDGRSGSTILAALLGNHEGFFPIGEIRDIWRAVKTDELCGCGEPFSSCEFWHRVGECAFGSWDHIDADAQLAADRILVRHRRLPAAFIALRKEVQDDVCVQHCEVLSHLYAAIREVSGCSVIVDSTKDPPYGLLLRRVPGLDVRFVHLLRDSRGVVYSWNKKGIRLPENVRNPASALMPSPDPWRSALKWVVTNVAFSWITRGLRRRVVKYEELVSKPRQEIERVLRLATEGRTPPGRPTETLQVFNYLPFHTVGGNPIRFKRGIINVQGDFEWRTEMRLSHKLIVSALTLPLLIAYGYVGGHFKAKALHMAAAVGCFGRRGSG